MLENGRKHIRQASGAPRLSKWLVALGFGATFGMLLLGGWVLLDARQNAWNSASQASNNLLLALDRDIERNINIFDLSLQGAIEALAEPGINNSAPGVRHHALFDASATAEDLNSILVLNEKGDVVEDATSLVPHNLNLADRDYFDFQKNHPEAGLYVSRPFQSRLRPGDWTISISRRLPTADGHFAGVITGGLRLDYFRQLFENLQLGQSGTITLLRTDGHIIYRYPYAEGDIDRDLSKGDSFKPVIGSEAGQYVAIAQSDRVERFYTFRRLGNLPLILSVNRSVSDIFAEWRQKALIIGATLTLLCGAAMTASLLFRRELLRRVATEQALKQVAEELATLASTDSLTGLMNRRTFDGRLETEGRRAARERQALSVLMLDVDHFKSYNDRNGHPEGDRALRSIADCIRQIVRRPADVIARYGGEEFIVILPNTSTEGAVAVGESIRETVAALRIANADRVRQLLTVSIGIATCNPAAGENISSIVKMADAALYRAKRLGRNCVVSADAAGQSFGAVVVPMARPSAAGSSVDPHGPDGREPTIGRAEN